MTSPAVSGINHVTLAVSDLSCALAFYRDLLGMRLRAEWGEGAYLEAGAFWLCLSLDPLARTAPHPDYTHLAFTVAPDDFEGLSRRVAGQAQTWKANRSEGQSLYFLDPDGHKLELHAGSLETRLAHYRENPRAGMSVFA